MEAQQRIVEEPKTGERYVHFKGEDRIYEVFGKAVGLENLGSEEGSDFLFKVRDCEDASRELDLYVTRAGRTLWINRGEFGKWYVVYKNFYEGEELEEFSVGTPWFRTLDDFVGFKEINGERVKRFTRVE
jgi:hypothetical protein